MKDDVYRMTKNLGKMKIVMNVTESVSNNFNLLVVQLRKKKVFSIGQPCLLNLFCLSAISLTPCKGGF
jgi:hypothetical protein